MAAMRVPLWLKIGWTVWVIAWLPFYWTQYGLQNFLFFCDLGNLFLMLALSRYPTPAETGRMTSFVAKHPDPVKGYSAALWVLLNSAEFLMNH